MLNMTNMISTTQLVSRSYRGRSRPGFGRSRPRACGVIPAPRRYREEGADRRKAPSYSRGEKRKRDEFEDYYYRPRRSGEGRERYDTYENVDDFEFDGVVRKDVGYDQGEDYGDGGYEEYGRDYYSYDNEGYGYENEEYDEEFEE